MSHSGSADADAGLSASCQLQLHSQYNLCKNRWKMVKKTMEEEDIEPLAHFHEKLKIGAYIPINWYNYSQT